MSRMTKQTKIKIFITAFVAIIALNVGGLVQLQKASAAASWCGDVKSWSEDNLGFTVGCGEEEVTFSKFEGGFAPPSTEGYAPGLTRVTTVRSFVLTFLNFALSFLGLLATAIVIYGGFLYVTARGDSEQADKGKKSISYAVIGIILILLSFALVNTLITEPFSEGNLQGENGANGAATSDGNGGVIGQSLNPMASEVKTSVTSLITMYSFYREVVSETAAMRVDMNKETTGETLSTVLQYLDSVISKMSNLEAKLPALNGTKKTIQEVRINSLSVLKSSYQNAKNKKDDDYLANWDADKKAIDGYFEKIESSIQKDLEKEVGTAKEKLLKIKGSISIEIDDQLGNQNSIHVIIDNLLGADYGLDSIIANLPDSDEQVKNVLSLYKDLYEALANMRAVKAVMTADITEGNAPLIVTFNMLNSVDPTGVTITEDRIQWKFGEVSGTGPQCISTQGNKAFQTCTFNEPGTYQATVVIRSSDPSKYLDGVAILPIKVYPRTATMMLSVGSGNNSEDMLVYSQNNQLLYEKKSVKFTLAEAKAGIVFNPSGTIGTNGTDAEIVSYYYNFGDNAEENRGSSDKVVTHFYGESGVYKVVYEIKDSKNKTNRKVFDLIIGSPVARISVSPNNKALIGQEVFLNGTSSSSETGQIVSYEWTIKGQSTGAVNLEENQKNQPTLNYTFTKDDRYEVTLKVRDSFNDDDSITTIIDVTSQAPISKYTYKVLDASQPSTYKFFGSKSYDPDGDINDAGYTYQWEIQPEKGFTFVEGSETSLNPIIQFDEKDEYEVSLLVLDGSKQGDAYKQNIVVDNILDVKWTNQDTAAQLNSDGEAEISFEAVSRHGVAYEIDFGDGETEGDDISASDKKISTKHTYNTGGKYEVRLTVFDENDDATNISRKVYIGDGTKPIASAKIFVDGQEINPDENNIEVSRKSVITFDASDSKNIDGTGRQLTYSWDFDDTGFSTQKTVTHTYKELKKPYKVKLKVADKDSQTDPDELTIDIYVLGLEPEMTGLTAVPQANSDGKALTTPLKVKVEAQGAEDGDGEIVQYRWYYYDVKKSSEPLGVQITESKQAYLTIGTRGKEGDDPTYKFAVEMIDNENNKVSSFDLLEDDEIPSIKVTNGANKQPTARFKVDRTTIFVKDSVTFTSESQDPDGQIISYIWDVEGDGFTDNNTTEKSTYTYEYKKQAKDGITVRLKVIDDKWGEAVSEPITIYVQSNGEPPKAAFNFTASGKKVQFTNNSVASDKLSIKEYIWDFDVTSNQADSDGDGVKDNDVDATSKNASWEYPDFGLYQAKLTVVDEDGNEDSVTNYVNVPSPTNDNLPKAAFKFTRIGNKKVAFHNNSTNPTGPQIVKYIWDFDIASNQQTADADGDGLKDNDIDSSVNDPSFEYPVIGSYQAKLTAIDSAGAQDSIVNIIDLAKLPVVNEATGQIIEEANGQGTFADGTNKAVLDAKLLSTPPISAIDGKIHLLGSNGQVTFDFSTSTGDITKYAIDKNIFFDSDGNGVPNDDKNLDVPSPGKWTTDFDKTWGKVVVKLTVYDKYGNSDNVLKEVVFDSPGQANFFSTLGTNLWAALVSLLAFVILSLVLYKKTK